ncbi:hypothetical protein L2E82_31476 [Cichorium intybus]|uniref:Uncharacterized protein n=1 Tax=Cichorium intybus TaxID=13427 RepID=A0ACB9BEY4_CICIN|nr:hypothetical protein L2E82_31476 [Cichorium intybus]
MAVASYRTKSVLYSLPFPTLTDTQSTHAHIEAIKVKHQTHQFRLWTVIGNRFSKRIDCGAAFLLRNQTASLKIAPNFNFTKVFLKITKMQLTLEFGSEFHVKPSSRPSAVGGL